MKNILYKLCIIGIVFSIAGSLCLGTYYKEVGGYLFFGALSAALFSDALAVVSLFCSKSEFFIARKIWIFLSLLVLIASFILVSPLDVKAASEMGILIDYSMLALSVPFGFFSSFLFPALSVIRPENFYLGAFCEWVVFFILGYIQWFVIAPLIVRGQVPR